MNASLYMAIVLNKILLNNNYYIISLDLKNNRLGDNGIKILALGISLSFSLVHIDLSSNGIGKTGADYLFKQLSFNQSITCLNIGNSSGLNRNFFNGVAIEGLNEFLKNHFQITFLDLNAASIGNEGLFLIQEGLKHTPSLKALNLCFNLLTSEASETLTDIMGKTNIKKLNLSQNHLGDHFKYKLFESTKNRIFLQTHLNFSRCKFTEEGMPKFFSALRKNGVLKSLVLDFSKYYEKDLYCFGTLMQNNQSLASLCIKGCKIGDKGLEHLASALLINSFLKELIVSNNGITV